jgi:hypothetical protein
MLREFFVRSRRIPYPVVSELSITRWWEKAPLKAMIIIASLGNGKKNLCLKTVSKALPALSDHGEEAFACTGAPRMSYTTSAALV